MRYLKVGFAISLILGLLPNIAVNAQETIVDSKCINHQQIAPDDGFRVFYKSEFKTKEQTYWLYSARYEDGSAIVCISKPGFKQARHLNLEPINSVFIDKLVKDSRNKTAFLITVRDGNGSYVPMMEYRLNLSIPSKPILTQLRTWTSKD
jgi:hypothetical protein